MDRSSAGRHRRARTPPAPESDWAWFFDIDGTLVEIAPSPDRIVVHDELPPLIRALHRASGGAVALITGRSIADVERLIPLEGMAIAGQHGLEIRLPGGDVRHHPVRDASLEKVRTALTDAVARYPGLIMEHKGMSIALHYREAPQLAGYSHRLMRSLRAKYVPEFVIQKGKRVVELRAAGRDKGLAIAEMMEARPFRGKKPVFIGDDVTDEEGFRVVNQLGGHSIKIGAGRTRATWRLRSVVDLRRWLRTGVAAHQISAA